jgi:glycosyltransferase involved in cell wall biosynthesis
VQALLLSSPSVTSRMLKISAVVCTRDRATWLKETLASLLEQSLPHNEYEIIVVDNGSGDDTRGAVEVLGGEVRYVHEPVVGLSHARNRGVREAMSDLVAFIDDDAFAVPEWLQSLYEGFQGPARPAAIGGKVELTPIDERVHRLPPNAKGFLGELDLGSETKQISFPVVPFGLNMAVRRQVLLELDGFSTRLGRHGTSLLSNEEVEFFRRVNEAGGVVLYEPRAVVRHRVAPERLTSRWMLRRSFAQGRSHCIINEVRKQDPGSKHLREALSALRSGTRGKRGLVKKLTKPDQRHLALPEMMRTAQKYGYAFESLKAAARARKDSRAMSSR